MTRISSPDADPGRRESLPPLLLIPEVIIEAEPSLSLDEVCSRMSETPPWAKGLVLTAEGYTTPFYRKM